MSRELSKLENAIGIDFYDPDLPPKVKKYIEEKILPRKGKIKNTEAQKIIKELSKLLNAKETKEERDLRTYINVLKQTDMFKSMSPKEQEESLDSLNVYLTSKTDFANLKPSALKQFEKPKTEKTVKTKQLWTIPRELLQQEGIADLYAHIPGDTLQIEGPEMEKIKKLVKKDYDQKNFKFKLTSKDKEKLNLAITNYNRSIDKGQFPNAEMFMNEIISIRPEATDSLKANLQEAKDGEFKFLDPSTWFK